MLDLTKPCIEVDLDPDQILTTPLLNKGTGFTQEERDELHLHGLLPPHISSIEEQVLRRYRNFTSKRKDIDKYIFLKDLQDRNEVLFYRLVLEHCEEMLPYVYTPTVGEASLDYSNLYSQNRGIYLSYDLKDKMEDILQHVSMPSVDVIVVTDGSRILGLGDVGIGGMTIPIGKLALYTLFGGIHPQRTLPILLDVGTDNPKLLEDPLYLGSKHPRITGKTYNDFIDMFIEKVSKRFPKVLLQWEDFSKPHARPLLDRYRKKICSFNDDIQGTAAVALAAILSALNAENQKLKDQKIAILGGGSAGLGIADYLVQEMKAEGLSEKEAYSRFYIVDIYGLIHNKLSSIEEGQKPFAQDYLQIQSWVVKNPNYISLEDVVHHAQPRILLGVSAQPQTFTQPIIETMASYCRRPIILPLSNPTSRAEADPKDIIAWSEGRAIIATGSPAIFVPYKQEVIPIGQCNNVYVFPGVGLGIIAAKATYVPDEVFLKAASILSEYAPMINNPKASIFPSLKDLRNIARHIGIEVARLLIEKGFSTQTSTKGVENLVDSIIWYPKYSRITRR